MRRKYKMTGCARFFIFLLIFAPIVLIGVSLYNGHNPVEQVKDLLGIEEGVKSDTNDAQVETRSDNDKSDNTENVSNEAILKGTIDSQKSTINELQNKVSDLEKTVKDRDKEILYLKQQLGNE